MLVAKEIVKMYCEVSEDEFETWLDNNGKSIGEVVNFEKLSLKFITNVKKNYK